MKATFLFLSALFLLAISAFGQEPEWKWQNPIPDANGLKDVHFINEQIGWITGDMGTISKTTNGGLDWIKQNSGTPKNLSFIQFVNFQNGWAAGENGNILCTTNGGNEWIKKEVDFSVDFISGFFIDSLTGFLVGKNGIIVRTLDGGNNWENLNTGIQAELRSVYFVNLQFGWVVGEGGLILKTQDGGNTWESQTIASAQKLNSVHFIDTQNGWAVGDQGTNIRTTNGGISWISSNLLNSNLRSVFFVNPNLGWIVGENNVIRRSTNGGGFWSGYETYYYAIFNKITFVNSQFGWIIGEGGILVQTNNSGNNWNLKTPKSIHHYFSVDFLDSELGWAVGYNGKVVKTTDKGENWIEQNSGVSYSLNSVDFVNPETGWVVGQAGTIRKTTNGGNIWLIQNSGTTKDLTSVHFFNRFIGWAVGMNGIILKTINGGKDWFENSMVNMESLFSVFFSFGGKGWAVGNSGRILKSDNWGDSWVIQSSPTTKKLNSVTFINQKEGWVVGESGCILKTINGGTTWATINSGTVSHLNSVKFISRERGFIFGDRGLILRTTNGGSTWFRQISGTFNKLYSGCFSDESHGWAVGQSGTIISTKTNNYLSPESKSSIVSGTFFKKNSNNCDLTTISFPGGFVKATPGPFYGIIGQNGEYKLRLPVIDSGETYFLRPMEIDNPGFQINNICPPSGQISIFIDTIPDTLSGHHFGFEITPCHHLEVQIASNRRRRCFRNITNVSYLNQGTVFAQNAYVLVEFPKWVRGISASASYTILNDSTWKFDLGAVGPGNGGQITITDSVICGFPNIRNLNQCTKAIIYPAPDCITTGGWTEAEVSVTGQCLNGIVDFGVYNATNHDMTDSLDYCIYLDSIQVKVGKIKLAANDSLHFWVQTNGMSATFTVNQVAGHPFSEFESSSMEACSDSTFFPRQMANHFPKANSPIKKYHCLPILDSFDPNDKLVFPIGFTANRIVKPGTEMEYLIRFQNTGNDTAYTVIVVDSLENNLNVESLKMGAVSHPYEITLETTRQGRNILRYQFNHIMLPDSNTNESKSHGFIQYRISPKADLALGSQARNAAEIYFDFNLPVVTNNTLTTFDNITFSNPALTNNVQIISSAKPLYLQGGKVQVFPNPFSGTFQIRSELESQLTITISDLLGKEVYSEQIMGSKEMNPGQLPAGVYWLTLHELNRTLKVVKER